MRQLVLPVLLASFVTVGCNSGGNNGNMGGKDAGGTGGTGEDMAKAPPPADMAMADPIMWPDPGTLPPADHDPTLHPAYPRLGTTVGKNFTPGVDSNPKDVMVSPKVYVVTWEGDEAIGQRVADFSDFFVKSDFWTKSMAEFGVGAGQGAQLVVLPGPPPATISQVFGFDDLVYSALTKAGVATNAIDANTVVSFVIDMNQKVTGLNGMAGNCTQFGGYHLQTNFPISSSRPTVSYTVAALCPGADGVSPDYDDLTVSQSHELEELASDPLPQTKHINAALNITGGGEIGDNCLNVNYALTNPANGQTYQVQRVYSDANAGKGTVDPCVVADGPFFGVGLWNGTNDTTSEQSTVTVTKGANNKGTATFTLQPFSYDNTVDEIEYSIVGSIFTSGVTFTPDIARRLGPDGKTVLGMRAFGKPGSTLKMTVDVDFSTYQAPADGIGNIIVFARLKSGKISVWWGRLNVVTQ
jgi:hypothetical protein